MNSRERAMKILHDKPVDRLPKVHFGHWQELLDEWADQGKIPRELTVGFCNGVGGMDKTALRRDKEAVDQEIERMNRLAEMGGFILRPDHRLMPGTRFERVQYDGEKIKKSGFQKRAGSCQSVSDCR